MSFLNLGCGSHYSTDKVWINLDFVSTGEGVIAHNLLNGIPFADNTFDLVYHSHVLEHFARNDASVLMSECYRVLRPGGVIRVAIPDLERIVRNYLMCMEKALQSPEDEVAQANYDWMVIEMYDQTVRNTTGGQMLEFLSKEHLINEEFIYQRIGEEGKALRKMLVGNTTQHHTQNDIPKASIPRRVINRLRKIFMGVKKREEDTVYSRIGQFRLSGEIHQWMYDRHSLAKILRTAGFQEVIERSADDSYISDWTRFELDSKRGITRKPDSLFVEAKKPR